VKKHWNAESDENAESWHTGKACIEKGCNEKAGTAWSPHWCWECNAKRLDRITRGLEELNNAANPHSNESGDV
jgi:hypothetical protein